MDVNPERGEEGDIIDPGRLACECGEVFRYRGGRGTKRRCPARSLLTFPHWEGLGGCVRMTRDTKPFFLFALSCAAEAPSCSWERRQALSRLLFGPVGYFSRHSLFLAYEKRQVSRGTARLAPSCPPSIRELLVDSGVLRPVVEGQGRQLSASESLLKEAVRMIFPSRELARLALQFTTDPQRLQQNLFGGRFLANVAQFNLSGALGTRGTFNFSQFFQRLGLPGFQNAGGPLDLAKPLSVGSDSNPAVESPGAAEKGETMNKPIAGSFGFEVNLRENQKALKSLASLLELPEFLRFLQHAVSVPEDIARDLGDVMEVALRSQGCEQAPGSLFVPSCTAEGVYEDVQCFAGQCWCVDAQGRELPGSRGRGGQPRCPTECEKQRAQMQNLLGSQPAGSSLFIPACTREGHFLPVQCFNSECYCVDAEGQAIPGTRSAPGEPKQCKYMVYSIYKLWFSIKAVTQCITEKTNSVITRAQTSIDGKSCWLI